MKREALRTIPFVGAVALGILINTVLIQFLNPAASIGIAIVGQTIFWIFLMRLVGVKIRFGGYEKPKGSFDSGRFGFAGIFRSGTPLPFVCVSCHFPHNKSQCPKCGSRMKRLTD